MSFLFTPVKKTCQKRIPNRLPPLIVRRPDEYFISFFVLDKALCRSDGLYHATAYEKSHPVLCRQNDHSSDCRDAPRGGENRRGVVHYVLRGVLRGVEIDDGDPPPEHYDSDRRLRRARVVFLVR